MYINILIYYYINVKIDIYIMCIRRYTTCMSDTHVLDRVVPV